MIGAVVALEDEAEALLSQMEIEDIRTIYGKTVHLGRAFGKECLLVVSGVGKVNAAAGACAAIHFGADVILNFGVAGGLHERTELTEVYLIEKAVQYDFDITQLEGTEIGTLDGETENFLPLSTPKDIDFPRRKLATGDRFNDSPVDHDLLLRLGADLRDMEGGAIVEVCKYAPSRQSRTCTARAARRSSTKRTSPAPASTSRRIWARCSPPLTERNCPRLNVTGRHYFDINRNTEPILFRNSSKQGAFYGKDRLLPKGSR